MGYVNCGTIKETTRVRLFEKKLSLFREVAISSIIIFKIGFIGIVKYCLFPVFLV